MLVILFFSIFTAIKCKLIEIQGVKKYCARKVNESNIQLVPTRVFEISFTEVQICVNLLLHVIKNLPLRICSVICFTLVIIATCSSWNVCKLLAYIIPFSAPYNTWKCHVVPDPGDWTAHSPQKLMRFPNKSSMRRGPLLCEKWRLTDEHFHLVC